MPDIYANITEQYDNAGSHSGSAVSPLTLAELTSAILSATEAARYMVFGLRNISGSVDWYNGSIGGINVFDGWDGVTKNGFAPWGFYGGHLFVDYYSDIRRFASNNIPECYSFKNAYLIDSTGILIPQFDPGQLDTVPDNSVDFYGSSFIADVFTFEYQGGYSTTFRFFDCVFNVNSIVDDLYYNSHVDFTRCVFNLSEATVRDMFWQFTIVTFTDCQFGVSSPAPYPDFTDISPTTLNFNNSGLSEYSDGDYGIHDYDYGFSRDLRRGAGAWYFSPAPIQYQHRHYRTHRKLAIF
jgi:hypothetical protein